MNKSKFLFEHTITDETSFPVMEHFYTIQGEGFFTGFPAYFIRLGGCDIGCHWCDVKESWDSSAHPKLSVDKLVYHASQNENKIVVITGGEPLMYRLDNFTKKLKEKNLNTHIETSGAYPLSGFWDWICLSPKKNMSPKNEVIDRADELKVVIYNRDDFRFAEEYSKIVGTRCKLYLQPEWSRRDIIVPILVDYVKKNTQWQISIQTHKYLNVP